MSTFNLGQLVADVVKNDAVSAGDPSGGSDYYSFNLGETASLSFYLSGMSADADLYLYKQSGTDYISLSSSTWGGTYDEDISTILDAGDYVVSVTSFYGATNYSLSIDHQGSVAANADYSGWGLSNSYGLGDLVPGTNITTQNLPENSLSITAVNFEGEIGDDYDAYSFTITAPSTVTINLTPDANSDIDLGLYDADDNWVTGSWQEGNAAESLTYNLAPGTYWASAELYGDDDSATYDLSISADTAPVITPTPVPTTNGDTLVNGMLDSDINNLVISNIVYSGMANQAAVVTNFAGIANKGVLLSTGDANFDASHTYNQFNNIDPDAIENPSDPTIPAPEYWEVNNEATSGVSGTNVNVFNQVDALVNTLNGEGANIPAIEAVHDAVTLSFDFTTNGDNNALYFDLMFGSEEFPEFVSDYVDGAVVMVDGVNYALFDLLDPKTMLSVTQSNVDAGYFNANTPSLDGTSSTYATEYDGISDLISILAPVDSSLSTHHVEISIADTTDHSYNSGLFLANMHGVTTSQELAGLLRNVSGSSAGNDVMMGSDLNDYADGLGGADNIDTQAGNDASYAGAGSDTVDSGDGQDYISGDAGNDSVEAGLGNDTLEGGRGRDRLFGDVGNDTSSGGEGQDIIDAGRGRDRLFGDAGTDSLQGGAGADTIAGGAGADSLSGGAAGDVFGYDSISDSGTTSTTCDTISDFGTGDRIDLSEIDANTSAGGNNAFNSFNQGNSFAGSFDNEGELFFDQSTDTLYGNNDSDAASDFSIHITGQASLTNTNFVL